MVLCNYHLPQNLKEPCVLTLDFLFWQAEQATDTCFFDNDKPSVAVGGSEEFNDGVGAKRAGCDLEAIELHQQQTHIVSTLHGHQIMIKVAHSGTRHARNEHGSVDLNKVTSNVSPMTFLI